MGITMSTARRVGEQVAKLYEKSAGREVISQIITENYDQNSRFQDPFFDVVGRDKVQTQFEAMFQHFDDYTLNGTATIDDSDEKLVKIDSNAKYIIKGKTFEIDQQTQLTLNSEGKVTFHHDVFKGSFTQTLE